MISECPSLPSAEPGARRAAAGDRLRHAKRSRVAFRSERRSRRQGTGRPRRLCRGAAGLARARRRRVLDGDGASLPAALARPTRAARRRSRRRRDDAARHARADRCPGTRARAGDRLARPAPGDTRTAAERFLARRAARRPVRPARCAISSARPRSTGGPRTSRQIWARADKVLLVSGFLNWKLTGRFVDSVGVAGRLSAVRLQAPRLGQRRRLEVAGARAAPRSSCPSCCRPGRYSAK